VLWDTGEPAEFDLVARQLREHAETLPIVDLGCGSGRQARAFARAGRGVPNGAVAGAGGGRGDDVRRADPPRRGAAADPQPICGPAPSLTVRKSLQHLKRLANNVDH
jgi:hypothetical protein